MMSARMARILAAAELPLVLAIAPALLLPTPRRLWALTVVPISWCIHRRTGGTFVPSTSLNAALWVILGMVVVSLFATFDVMFSLGKVAGLTYGIVLFWAIVRWTQTAEKLAVATATFVCAGVALAIVGSLGVNRWVTEVGYLVALVERYAVPIRGIPGAEDGFNPNPVAGSLLLIVPLQIALIGGRIHSALPGITSFWRRALLVLQWLLLFITAAGFALMVARAAWLAAGGAAIGYALWRSRRLRVLGAVLAVASLGSFLAVGTDRAVREPIRYLHLDDDIGSRLRIWERALQAIGDRPLTGVGMNVFRTLMSDSYPLPVIPEKQVLDLAHAHNHLLQAALDLGIPGLLAYISLWAVSATLLVDVRRRSPGASYRALAAGLGFSFLAYFLFSLADAIPLGAKVGTLFWIALALTVSLHRVAVTADGARSENHLDVIGDEEQQRGATR